MGIILLTFSLGLSITDETGEVAYAPAANESQVPELFRLTSDRFAYDLTRRRDTTKYSVSALEFPSPIITPDVLNNTVHAEYFRPRGPGKHPAVVVLHILGADFALSRYMAARLADRGIAAVFLKLPYYGERRDPKSGHRFLSTDVERSMGSMRQGVCDVRRAAAWLASRPEIDGTKLGVTGISLGGIVSSLCASVDPIFQRSVLLLAGGGLGEIMWEMPEAARYRRLWQDTGKTKKDLIAMTRPFDPLTYAGRLKGRQVLMMAGRVDEVIPPSATKALWNEAGRPELVWLDCGHYSAAGFLLPAIRQTVDFFAQDLPDEP